jgi:thioester reductase-like protein
MSSEDRENVVENVHVVLHCAATVDYHERLDLSLEVTTKKRRLDSSLNTLFLTL